MIRLTPKQEKFAQEVASGKNQSDAYRIAYPACHAWKPSSVHEHASALMANSKVRARYEELTKAAAEVALLEVAAVLRQVRDICCSDIAGIMHADGRVKLPNELDAATRAAIKSFKIDEYGRIEYHFWDKNAALDKAMKVLGLYREDNKQKSDPLTSLLQRLPGNVFGVTEQPAHE